MAAPVAAPSPNSGRLCSHSMGGLLDNLLVGGPVTLRSGAASALDFRNRLEEYDGQRKRSSRQGRCVGTAGRYSEGVAPATGIRMRSDRVLWGLPLYEIAVGPDPERERARGHGRVLSLRLAILPPVFSHWAVLPADSLPLAA